MSDNFYVGQTFGSWAEAEKALDSYAHLRFFQWRKVSSSAIKGENLKAGARGEKLNKQELNYKNIVLSCAWGGKK